MAIKKDSFYVTTPIYYVTAKPHLGHLYSTVIADVLARWNKLKNKDVLFLTGTDEFGQKIAQAAQKAEKAPQEFVDSFIDAYKKIWKIFEIDYDIFMRTTNTFHINAVQKWLLQLQEKGDIYKSFYKGWYCTQCETFVTEEAEGVAPECPSCTRQTHQVAEEAYFFKLSAYQDRLLEFYHAHPDFIIPHERAQEVINFVKAGLKDLSISRTTVKWGVPFPNDSKHVTYVWADALNNYITAIGWGDPQKKELFNSWWPADIQVMGKDILRFHAIYWPAFLMASGLELPKHLLVHGWFKVGTQKMSKSLGNVIDPTDLYEAYGADAVRYYLMRQMAITHDGEFTIEDLEQKISSELADDLGNLLNRMIALAQKYSISSLSLSSGLSVVSQELQKECQETIAEYSTLMNECHFHKALARLWRFINQTNAYFHSQEPWKIAKTNPELFKETLAVTAHVLYTVAILLWPIMPKKMEQLLASLGIIFERNKNYIEPLSLDWKQTFMITKIENLFQKPIPATITETVAEQSVKEPMEAITIDEFAKVKLMVGTIEQCQIIEKSDKLLQLQVNFGKFGQRQILSGIRKLFSIEQLIGKQALFVVNLEPRKMMGLESHGMLLLAQDEENKASLMVPQILVQNGTLLK